MRSALSTSLVCLAISFFSFEDFFASLSSSSDESSDEDKPQPNKQVVQQATPEPANTAELSLWYRRYVIYEAVLVNILGFFTLFFQCKL